jgi:HlyD family secretion protein
VVTYTVIVNAPNPELKLMPGMTANITVLVQKLDSVLIIPGKALRFTPDATWLAEYMKNNPFPQRQGGEGVAGARGTGESGQFANAQRPQNPGGYTGQSGNPFQGGGANQGKKPVVVWVKNGDKFHRTRISTGAIDGSNAEIKTGLKEGDEIVLSMTQAGKTGSATTAAAPNTTTSPFMPTRPGGGRGR